MARERIGYFLPTSAVRITGTHTVATDEALKDADGYVTRSVESAAELVLVADRPCVVEVKQGWMFQVGTNLAFADDGRLTSAAAESTGELVAQPDRLAR